MSKGSVNVLLYVRPEPTLFIDDNAKESPWVNASDVEACGALILINTSETAPNPYLSLFRQASLKGDFFLTWGHAPRGKEQHYVWAIKPPVSGVAPCRLTKSPS
jgi:hypothetical protein